MAAAAAVASMTHLLHSRRPSAKFRGYPRVPDGANYPELLVPYCRRRHARGAKGVQIAKGGWLLVEGDDWVEVTRGRQ